MTSIVTLTVNPTIDVSTTTDKVRPTYKVRCGAAQHDPGGGGINVARVLKRIDGGGRAVYPVGGSFGQHLRELLDDEGVDSRTVPSAAETRLAFTVQEEGTDTQYRFVLAGSPLVESEWQGLLDCLRGVEPKPDWIVASGSLAPGVPEDFYARVAEVAAAMDARLVIDTSGPALKEVLGKGVFLAKPNLRELRDFTGEALETEADWCRAAREMVASGQAEAVALTMGDQGAVLATTDSCVRAAAPDVEPASAVGAGDSFLAGMVWRLSSGHDLTDAFAWGMAAGAAALITPGTELCRKEDVERLRGQVKLETV